MLVLMALSACAVPKSSTSPAPGTPAGAIVIDFDKAPIGEVPPGFTTAKTGDGPAGTWVVRQGNNGQVVAQTSPDPTNRRYPVLIYDTRPTPLVARDVDVAVRFRPVSGKVDQAAGIVVRYHDPGNYYVLRANALEDNVRIYRVKDGKRLPQFASIDAKVASGQWQTLRLVVTGPSFTAYLNDRLVFQAADDSLKTAGKVGLWTKADSVSEFDDLTIAVLDR